MERAYEYFLLDLRNEYRLTEIFEPSRIMVFFKASLVITTYQRIGLIQLGSFYRDEKKYDSAIKQYKIALKIQDNHVKISELNYHLGYCYDEQQEYNLAIEHYKRALAIFETTRDDLMLIPLYTSIGKCYKKKQDCTTAIEYFKKALELISNDNDDIQICELYDNISSCYYITEQYHRALEYSTKSLFIKENNVHLNIYDLKVIAHFNHFVGLCYSKMEQYDLAIHYFNKMLKMWEQYPSFLDVGFKVHENIATMYMKKKQYHLAIEHYKKELVVSKDQYDNTDLHVKIGECYQRTYNYELAVLHYKTALEVLKNTDDDDDNDDDIIQYLMMTTAHLYFKVNQYDSAVEWYTKVLNMTDESSIEHSKAVNGIAKVWYEKRNYEQSWSFCSKSMNNDFEKFEIYGKIFHYYGEQIFAYNCFVKSIQILSSSPIMPHYRKKYIKRIQKALNQLK
ncbi:unnamed protein product [Didymodactylos carnosus]|uniref:Uncharacterized protein n=1 Tax=Didymodactylos carnosus TaxID=1234261 RepID=A0A815SLG1_9BILA|nr:unnamed protein product [Didymodactylos carnosus]CAF4354841.1 unnamed protein product [Didymodactylos carnosus]